MPAEAVAPAPVSPSTPTPAARPAPANRQPSTQATPRIEKPADTLNDSYAALEALGELETGEVTPKTATPTKRNESAAKDDASEGETSEVPAKAEPKTEAKATPEVELKPGEFPTEEQATKMRAGQLSRHYKELKKAYSELQSKSNNPNIQEHPEFKKISTEAQTAKQRADAAEQELRYTKFESSEEYKTQYWEPYKDSFTKARARISGLTVMERKDVDTGDVLQASRKATPEDFDRIVSIDNDDQAADLAEQLFGQTKASIAMIERSKVLELNQKKELAKENYRKEGGAREEARQEQQKKSASEIGKLYKTEVDAAIEKYPQWFKPSDGDERGNSMLEKGFEFADSAFTGSTKGEDGKMKKLSPQELAKVHSVVRNKAAGFDRMVLQNKRANSKIKELQAQLDGFKASEPKPGDGSGKGSPSLTLSQSIDEQLSRRADRR